MRTSLYRMWPLARGGRRGRLVRPEPPQLQLDGLERLDANDGRVFPKTDDGPGAVAQLQDLDKRAIRGVH